ncbi:uncharacterized protein LOC119671524 [Teleopsis dalmanni]|uniref:uncharacterized protein LOC119671524 n=1 Tax=Teleopsis dalmanni TaxID=139649 RepID=UPI0018CD2C28|nr:uncharacterized protein LOC119671524 [Teleopsis dalmanni]
MSVSGSDKIKNEKLAAMWMYAAQMGTLPPQTTKTTSNGRRIMLIPASAGNNTLHATPPPATGMMLPPPLIVPTAMSYRGMPVPYVRPSSLLYAHPNSSLNGTYRTQRSTKSADIHSQRRRRRAGQMLRAGKMDANRRQRRKSEADVIDGEAFQYTGLDRAIADSFLARQEQSNAGSQIDYSSSSSAASGTFGKSSHSSKAKIVCRDVVM